jgi:3-oxoacyl-[acyl-carrier-protein] synthase-3
MTEICETLTSRNGLTIGDIDLLIPHQANARIISGVAERLGLPIEKTVINIQDYGNTTGGTIPLATRDALEAGRLKRAIWF